MPDEPIVAIEKTATDVSPWLTFGWSNEWFATPYWRPQMNHGDYLWRVKTSDDLTHSTVTVWNTSDLTSALTRLGQRYDRKIDVLRSIVKWQKCRLDYQSTYTAYLLGTLSEAEFEEEADKFTTEDRNLSKEQIGDAVAEIDEALGAPMQTVDYADFLEVDVADVIAAEVEIQRARNGQYVPYFSQLLTGC